MKIKVLFAAATCVVLPLGASAQGLGSCADPWGVNPPMTGVTRAVHPDILRQRFGRTIAAGDMATAVAGYVAVIDSTLNKVSPASPTFAALRDSLKVRASIAQQATIAALRLPRQDLAHALEGVEINQFRPAKRGTDNRLVFLQRDQGAALGVVIDTLQLSPDERTSLCWSAWSLHRLLQNVNFQTVPAALVRIEAQETRWQRYRANGPTQLPHELVLNRVRRAIFPPRGANRFNPPVFDLVALHPFAGIEFTRTDGRVLRTESAAVETGGFTLWLHDWRQPLGVSWVIAYDADGNIGRGPLVRGGGYLTAGLLTRKDDTGKSRRSFLVSLDLARLLKTDAAPQALRQAQSVAGEVLK